jgi:hypothetical protein
MRCSFVSIPNEICNTIFKVITGFPSRLNSLQTLTMEREDRSLNKTREVEILLIDVNSHDCFSI